MTTSRLFAALFAASVVSMTPPLRAQQTPRVTTQADVTMGLKRDPALAATIAEISATQIRATDSALVSF